MTTNQFRVLYRQFLFRMVDLELLSADAKGDLSKLFGQFAALLIFISLALALLGFGFSDAKLQPSAQIIASWSAEHFLIATTMLIVGLFAVLSWDSTFPDKRDVLVLAPLPVRTRTMFVAKIAAVAMALSIAVAALHIAAGFIWPLALNPASGGILQLARVYAAYWLTMFAAGAFILCCVLGAQGVASQLLPRQLFLRASSFLQLAAFGLFIAAYFLEPKVIAPGQIAALGTQPYIEWSPSYWFLGLFQQLNGSAALAPLAKRAWIGLAAVFALTAVAYSLSYLRTIRQIVEAPDIASGSRLTNWLPSFGNPAATAISQFSVRTVLRSRQHRLIFAFYLGVGFAAAILFPKWPPVQELSKEFATGANSSMSLAVAATTILFMGLSVLATRVAFSLPMDLRANWIFRIAPVPQGPKCLTARRRAFYAVSVLPVWAGSAVLTFCSLPRLVAVEHVLALAVLGAIFAEIGLFGVQKIPFTCSYLPGKSNFHITFLLCTTLVLALIAKAAQLELRTFADIRAYAAMLAVLIVAAMIARGRNMANARSPEGTLQFEETADPAICGLNLDRDGFHPAASSAK